MEGEDSALPSGTDNPTLASGMGRKGSLWAATHTNVPLVILPDLDVFAGCIHLQQVPKLLLVHLQVGHSDRVVDQVVLIDKPEGLGHGSWDDALLIFIDGSWRRDARGHWEQGTPGEPVLAGDRAAGRSLPAAHASTGKEQPHNPPAAQPSQPGLNIPLRVFKPQDLGANPIPLLPCTAWWLLATLLVSSPSSRKNKKGALAFQQVANAVPAATACCPLKSAQVHKLSQLRRSFLCTCSLLVSGHSTLPSGF